YVTKSFSPRELVRRVRARLRRRGGEQAPAIQRLGELGIDREGQREYVGERPLELTRYEYALLEALARRPGAILSRAQLMERAWTDGSESLDRTVETHVKTLRRKLKAAGFIVDPIRTHRGLGYALEL